MYEVVLNYSLSHYLINREKHNEDILSHFFKQRRQSSIYPPIRKSTKKNGNVHIYISVRDLRSCVGLEFITLFN